MFKMEKETQVGAEFIAREGEPIERETVWIAPEVLAARAGIPVDFSRHTEDPEDELEDELRDIEPEF